MFDNYSPILTTDELAEILKLNKKTILKLIKDGNLPFMKVGNQYRFSKDKIIQWINSHMSDFFDLQVYKKIYNSKDLKISDFLHEDFIVYNIKPTDKYEVLKSLVNLTDNSMIEADKNELLQMVLLREKQYSTAIGDDFALPHPRSVTTNILKNIYIAVGIFKDGFIYDEGSDKKIHIVILFAVPYLPLHLEILSQLAKLLSYKDFKDGLINSNNSKEIIELFKQYEKLVQEQGKSQ